MQDAVAPTQQEPVIATCSVRTWDLVVDGLWIGGFAVYFAAGLVHYSMERRYVMAAFAGAFLVHAARQAYDYGWRKVVRLELTPTSLRKITFFGAEEFPVLSIRAVYLGFRRNRAKKLEIDGARPGRTVKVPLYELNEVDPFLSVLTTAAPGIKVHVSPLSAQQRQL
jgi:hypothetical protein